MQMKKKKDDNFIKWKTLEFMTSKKKDPLMLYTFFPALSVLSHAPPLLSSPPQDCKFSLFCSRFAV